MAYEPYVTPEYYRETYGEPDPGERAGAGADAGQPPY